MGDRSTGGCSVIGHVVRQRAVFVVTYTGDNVRIAANDRLGNLECIEDGEILETTAAPYHSDQVDSRILAQDSMASTID